VKAVILQSYAKPDWPLAKAYPERWPASRVVCGEMPSLRYRTKLGFVLQLPKLFLFGFREGLAALKEARPPEVFVVHTDPEVIGMKLAQLLRWKRVPIVICGFIYTLRKSTVVNFCRRLYFRVVLSMTDGVICHSRLEVSRYASIFGLKEAQFDSVPFALNVQLPAGLDTRGKGYVLSAGRAERDYGLLSEAWTELPQNLHIVCDTEAPLRSVKALPNITLLRRCFDVDYMREITGADFVVVPLKDKELSAGQMVLLQSMAVGKAVIISRTPTTEEYGEHRKTLYFVEHGSAAAIREAVRELAADPDLRASIGAAGQARYRQRHTVHAYVNGVLSSVERLLGRASADDAALGTQRGDSARDA